eukprot:361475-Chlamydomonas_euryale.AAC.8
MPKQPLLFRCQIACALQVPNSLCSSGAKTAFALQVPKQPLLKTPNAPPPQHAQHHSMPHYAFLASLGLVSSALGPELLCPWCSTSLRFSAAPCCLDAG